MDKIITLAEKERCTGCGACKETCPKGAISFLPDQEGFPSPVIDDEKCIRCGMCEKACPALHMPETHAIQAAYAAQINDEAALKDSTSGGLFTAFAREAFRRDGVVYGCVWDDEYHAVIRKAENEEEIKPMRGSKYVWSWAGDAFPEIKAYLESGRTVLFTGLPCQAAGLKSYLKKNYDNLLLVDCLCSGAPSPMALDLYLDTICKKEDRKNLNLKFRDKDPYGVGVHITYTGKKKRIKKGEHIRNPYYWSFYTRLVDRESCYQCPYGSGDRVSDITIGDFWGISEYHQEFKVRDGVSALLVNSDKGKQFLAGLTPGLNLSETDPMNIAKENNLFIGNRKRNIHKPLNRADFFSVLKEKGWKAAERRFLFTKGRMLRMVYTALPARGAKLIRKIVR